KARCYQLASNHWSAASKACCHGSDSLFANFRQPRECHANLRAPPPQPVCDSVLDWRVGPSLFTAFDPPNFSQPVQSSKLSLIGPQRGPVKISEEIVDM